jgi:hypothetical protein
MLPLPEISKGVVESDAEGEAKLSTAFNVDAVESRTPPDFRLVGKVTTAQKRGYKNLCGCSTPLSRPLICFSGGGDKSRVLKRLEEGTRCEGTEMETA